MVDKKSRLILKSGNTFDSIKGKILESQTIVIKENVIEWIGNDDQFEKEQGDKIIDVSGKTILPGLIECHVHLEMTGNPQYEREYLRTKTAMWPFVGLNNAQRHLMSGFTCVRDCGASPDWSPALKRIFNQGILAGPRLIVCDRFMGQPGTEEAVIPDTEKRYYRENYEIISGADGVKHAVRERKYHGADFIKTATTGGVLHGIESKLERSFWTDDELTAMVEEAHRMDMHIACHAHGREGIHRAIKAKIDTIEHGSFLDEETAALMVKNKTFLVPTQSALVNLMNSSIITQLPEEVQRKTKETSKVQMENHKMALEKGVQIAIGTDAGTPGNYHGKTATEIRFMVENIGMTPIQALQAATIVGAKALQMEGKIGSLEKGKLADVVVCKGNPVKDVSVLEKIANISLVIRDGKIMVENGRIVYFN